MKVEVIRGRIGSKLLAALAAGGKWLQGKQPSAFIQHGTAAYRPTGAALRNPADPIQAARIEAAVVKRARRADKLHLQTRTIKNMTHRNCANRISLNPFYVAK